MRKVIAAINMTFDAGIPDEEIHQLMQISGDRYDAIFSYPTLAHTYCVKY
ncbi:hypothetical protein [Pedobacter boryungensis]|uniref:Uncharacterized protein n=1 Tax=Pedobacter boryungensis TaxID=869962 RepID=A0ABX2DHK3_9SPHI|nr:hypothetical protein [Pedobacter boryungensis]NQX33008.1 hypothetical protein [Pedobacter boryungensis]